MFADQEQVEKLFQKAFGSFDWERAAEVYQKLGWKWIFVGIPGVEDIKKTVKSLHSDLMSEVSRYDSPHYTVTTGGLEVAFFNGKYPTYTISVIVTTCFARGDERVCEQENSDLA